MFEKNLKKSKISKKNEKSEKIADLEKTKNFILI